MKGLQAGRRFDVGEASDYVQWALRKGYANDYGHCSGMYLQLNEKYSHDPFTTISVARYCMSLQPAHPGGHLRIAESFAGLIEPNFLGSQLPAATVRGAHLRHMQRYAEARECYLKALRAKPDYSPAKKGLTLLPK